MDGPDALDEDTARWLTGEGLTVVARIAERFAAGDDALAVGADLRRDGLDGAKAAGAAAAAQARLAATAAGWDTPDLLATTTAVEQASHPLVANWRAQRFAGRPVADLCAGVGGDATALARHAAQVVAVERDAARTILLAHNLRNTPAHVVQGDALAPPVPSQAQIHADPGRRTPRGRARNLGEYLPDVGRLLAVTARFPGRGLTVSPAIDLDDPVLPVEHEMEFLDVGGRLVEAVVWTGELRVPGIAATATLLPEGHQWQRTGGQRAIAPVGPIGALVVEPRPALVRARAHDELAERTGARRIARSRSLLTLDDDPGPSPWYVRFVVEAQLPAQPRAVRAWLRTQEPEPLEIATAGFDADPQRWWHDLGRPDRGPQGRRLLLVRLDDGAAALALRAM